MGIHVIPMPCPWDSPINITSNATGVARAMAMSMLQYKYIIPFRPRFLNFSPLAPGADPEGGGGRRPTVQNVRFPACLYYNTSSNGNK